MSEKINSKGRKGFFWIMVLGSHDWFELFLFFFYCCIGWGYLVAFTNVLRIYQIEAFTGVPDGNSGALARAIISFLINASDSQLNGGKIEFESQFQRF
jgi:hypothetical protein